MAIIRRLHRGPKTEIDDNCVCDTPYKIFRFAEQNGLSLVPFDIEGLVKMFKIKIRRVKLKSEISGILVKEKEEWEILVNNAHHLNRQRYTIAHELAHYCLHKHYKQKFEDQIFFRGVESDKEEMQANAFASEILMPEQEFRKLVDDGIRQIDLLADKFGVSTLALRIRAKSLGMLGHGL
jgi:Zn-dependent peptidase ImmA (M78 family)